MRIWSFKLTQALNDKFDIGVVNRLPKDAKFLFAISKSVYLTTPLIDLNKLLFIWIPHEQTTPLWESKKKKIK